MIFLYIKSRLFCHYYWNIRLPRFALSWFLFRGMVRNGIPRIWQFAFILVPRNGIPSCVLFRRRVRNRIMGVCFFFVSWNGIPSCFLFRGRVRNGIPRCCVPRNNRNSVGNNHSFRLFRLPRNNFLVGNCQPYLQGVIKICRLSGLTMQ